jgi:acyl-CoA synthetase (NDP forming)
LMDRSAQLSKLLSPATVAVVGASQRPGWGLTTIQNLDGVGFTGTVYPVNPRYEEVAGRPCFPSLRDLPEPPDAVAIALPAALVPATVEEAMACGAAAAVVYASGFGAPGQGEGGSTGPDSLRAKLAEISQHKEVAIQGPNCLGMINYARRASLWGITMEFGHAGTDAGVALIAQSGNMALTVSRVNRGFSLSHLVSCGNQIDVTAAELMSASLEDPAARALAVMVESIPDIDLFRAALVRAADADVPVVVLKIGNSARARQAAIAHTGSLSGSAALHRSFLRQFGAIQVDDLDELGATLALVASGRRPRRSGVAVFASSGGECGLVADVAESVGLKLPDLPAEIAGELAALLPDYGHVANPLDLTAGSWANAPLYAQVIEIISRASNIGTIAGIGDAPTLFGRELAPRWQGIISGLGDGIDRVRSSGAVVAGLSSVTDLNAAVPAAFTARGVVPLAGLRPGLAALAKAGWYADWYAARAQRDASTDRRGAAEAGGPGREAAASVRQLLAGRPPGPVPEHVAKQVLALYGIGSPEGELSASPEEAASAAARLGLPVVLKVAADGIHHKTDVGGVLLDVRTADEVSRGAAALLAIGREADPSARVLVERFISGGLELIIGGRQDETFGPVVLAGIGGVLAEFLADVTHRLAPVSQADAESMLDELTGRRLLDGYRGQPGANVAQVAAAIAAVSALLIDHPGIAELDVNPLVTSAASSSGTATALDALLVLSESG